MLRDEVKVVIGMPPKDVRRPKSPRVQVVLEPVQQARFEALRQWRTQVAREQAIAPFIVFHDKALIAIAEENPASLGELGRVPGVGTRKLELYGDAILATLAAP